MMWNPLEVIQCVVPNLLKENSTGEVVVTVPIQQRLDLGRNMLNTGLIGGSHGVPNVRANHTGNTTFSSRENLAGLAAKKRKSSDALESADKANIGTEGSSGKRKRTAPKNKPSAHCHICTRSGSSTLPVLVCSGISKTKCRKIICKKCFESFHWNWEQANASPDTWICAHCNGMCPPHAQCHVYKKTNERRRRIRALNKLKNESDE
mmetsp:Transcript_8087/g.14647  ORF Transcript_8087/g.14647 Transcript_8087/m.14647 type:complete len:207 (-) Transcript_8087:973-1593(-)